MTTVPGEALPSEEIETVGSASVPRRIYAYTLPGKDNTQWQRTVGQAHVTGVGLIKVGETTKPNVLDRIKQQLGTAYPNLDGVKILLDTEAKTNGDAFFRDHDVHRALVAKGIRKDHEWFEATLDEVQAAVVAVRNGTSFDSNRTADFGMRPEQEEAVARTAGYCRSHAPDEMPPKFLWNAKMRFGKTFTTYQLAREMGWTRVLVLTYKPAVQTAWKEDLLSHVDFEGWKFVDRESSGTERDNAADDPDPLVWFASFQDLKGRDADGKIKEHNEAIHLIDWDCIVLDEYHFGAWRDSARDLYDPTDTALAEEEEPEESVTEEDLGLRSAHYLYLSGTPFRAITNGEFTEDQIFNWTYTDEQREKEEWDPLQGTNPYIDLPGMQIYSYQMGDQAEEWAADGEFNGFGLTEYFRAKKVNPTSRSTGPGAYVFEDETRVADFLEMLRGKLTDQMKVQIISGQKPPFPYEAPVFAKATTHSVWYMADVAACFALRDALENHPYFSGFEIVVAAGSRAGQGAAAKPPVEDAIDRATKNHRSGSITLSCGKLMTGVTIREWGAILMLRSLKSPESYFQAAFRIQSPWAYRRPDGSVDVQKETVYVFEFDPNRALSLVAEYGMRLGALGDITPKDAVGQLLNYLPIFAFAGGAMTRLDAAEVLNWATAGVGATALAQRWNSPVLVNINEHTLAALLGQQSLLDALEQIEDFRNLAQTAQQVVTSSKLLKQVKRAQGGNLTRQQRQEQTETAKRRKEIREKLQKLLAKIPVFMYVTDFREQALKDIIFGADSALFERVTGITVDDFELLNSIGVFNPIHMHSAIYQFKAFEDSSLQYANEPGAAVEKRPIGLWDKVLQPGELLENALGDNDAAAAP
ncbi:DEAD/DEAH box helicase [Mycobacterium sp. Dal123C01]|uniref:DEAD/DEAH box helicase n=1 Tax=Mycobacterium sp. Dal123C01 TaxID=3457577 RepID=UPI00403E3E67